MYFRFSILALLVISFLVLQCQSSPTSSNDDEETIENPDDTGGDSGGGGTEEPEPLVIEIPNDYSPFYPYQSLIYYSEDFDIEDYGFEFVYGVDPEDANYSLYKRFDLVYYQDTLAVGDTLSAKVTEWGQWSVIIPRVSSGIYNFTVFIKEDLLLKGEVEILPIGVISDPSNYIQSEFSKFKNQMDLVRADAQKVIDEVPEFDYDVDEEWVEEMTEALQIYNDLEQKILSDIQTASPEELERLAYFMKAYEDILNEEYEPYEDVLAKVNEDPLEEPESAFESGKKWLTNKLNFQGILNSFWNSDTENVEVGEGELVETAKTWTVYGQAISIITGIQERFTKVFMLTTDKLEAELSGDFSDGNDSNPKRLKGQSWPYRDSLYFEYNQPVRIAFQGEYENLREDPYDEAPWPNPATLNVITDELYELIDDIGVGFGELRIFPLMRQDTTNITTTVSSKYLEFRESDTATLSEPFFDVFNVTKDESTGEFIVTAKPFTDDNGDTFYGERKAVTWLQYYQDEEYKEFDFMFFATQCPDFSLFIPGKWESVFYKYDDLADIFQIDRIEFFEDGTWRIKDYFLVDQWYQYEDYATGTWRSGCEDGEAWFYYTDDFFGVTWSFEYDGDKNRLLGYRWRYDTTYSYDGPTQVLRKAEF